jgi:hypothetical protein
MKLLEMPFTTYYHKFVVIEADVLTERCSAVLKVKETDCYALCSSYCSKAGELCFHILSIGSDWNDCSRGLRYKKMLGEFAMHEVIDCEARVAEDQDAYLHKNDPYQEKEDDETDDGVLKCRLDARLDDIRDPYRPDAVEVGILDENSLYTYHMRITGVKGLFAVGILLETPEDKSIDAGEKIYALAYSGSTGNHLLAVFAGDKFTDDEQKVMDYLLKMSDKMGLDFNGVSIKN